MKLWPKILARTTADGDGNFELTQPADRLPFNLIFLSPEHPVVVMRDIVLIKDTLDIQMGSLADGRYFPGAKEKQDESVRKAKSMLRTIDEARDLLPGDKEIEKKLLAIEKRILFHKKIKILIPAYFYPDSAVAKSAEWKQLFALATKLNGKAELIVILNIYDGSGKRNPKTGDESKGFDENYANLLKRLTDAKIKWVGYIAAQYGNERKISLLEDFQFWIDKYPTMAGVFVDELPDDPKSASSIREFCSQVREHYEKAKKASPLIIGNPGRQCSAEYGDAENFDWMCVNESPHGTANFQRPSWANDSPAVCFGSISYGIKNSQQLEESINSLIAESGEFIFITDQDGKSEPLWTRMPKPNLLAEFASKIQAWNELVEKHKGIIPPFLNSTPRK